MKQLLITIAALVLVGCEGSCNTNQTDNSANVNTIIKLPIRFHVLHGVTVEKKGVTMDMWVKDNNIHEIIVPELNRIWKPARIEWYVESILAEKIESISDKQSKAIKYIANSRRDSNGKSNPRRIPLIYDFFNERKINKNSFNIFLFPYIGGTSQGNAKGKNRAIVGVWTDKPSRGIKPPERFKLSEKPPFKIGSIARTCAHELGHNLGLRHPDKSKQKIFGRLMGGRRHGYLLTKQEILTARKHAIKK